ncbi:hypothetical protein [uncultured Vibrio sp.]|uniref:hypothetical protein n=1 Tax=uncultured Vibrio sp. TaxID=114054 RepID=UPI00091B1D0A|nr:hypothetical protein [uncultured Vibrio sp.]OIQ26196.1 MAG: hypothetical protein BM561_00060 [Vibrio sp. MedPE-SWchi]
MNAKNLLLLGVGISVFIGINSKSLANEVDKEKVLFNLSEEATCLVAANYLDHDRYAVHVNNFKRITIEYSVPTDMSELITARAEAEYGHFIERANKRYEKEVLPTMLLSAYTHRCLFMNGYEAGRQFNSEPPTI